MNRTDLAEILAEKHNLSKAKAEEILRDTFDTISNQMAAGGDVALHGFGTFSVTKTAARTGRNPKTGETLQIAARNKPGFKPSAGLKRDVNGG